MHLAARRRSEAAVVKRLPRTCNCTRCQILPFDCIDIGPSRQIQGHRQSKEDSLATDEYQQNVPTSSAHPGASRLVCSPSFRNPWILKHLHPSGNPPSLGMIVCKLLLEAGWGSKSPLPSCHPPRPFSNHWAQQSSWDCSAVPLLRGFEKCPASPLRQLHHLDATDIPRIRSGRGPVTKQGISVSACCIMLCQVLAQATGLKLGG